MARACLKNKVPLAYHLKWHRLFIKEITGRMENQSHTVEACHILRLLFVVEENLDCDPYQPDFKKCQGKNQDFTIF